MKKILGFVLVAAVAVTAVVFASAEDKVTICHIPEGNPQNMQTITIGVSAAEKHLAEHKSVVDGVTYADYKGECRKQATEETACAIMNDIVKSYVDQTEKVDRAINLATDVQTAVAKYSPAIADLYYQKATIDQQYKVQEGMVANYTRTPCTSFCDGIADPKTGEITCSSGSYVEKLDYFSKMIVVDSGTDINR